MSITTQQQITTKNNQTTTTKGHEINIESRINQTDLEAIKIMLNQGYNETEIGIFLKLTKETISRKISAWTRTQDFKDWIPEHWLHLHTKAMKDSPVEAYKQVSRLFTQLLAQRPDVTTELKTIELHWLGPSSTSPTSRDATKHCLECDESSDNSVVVDSNNSTTTEQCPIVEDSGSSNSDQY